MSDMLPTSAEIIPNQPALPFEMAVVEGWKNNPTFLDLVQAIKEYSKDSYHDVFVESRHAIKADSWNITTFDITCVVVLTAVLSTMRYILDKYVSMPLTRYYDIPKENRKKVPEHLWRFIYFLCIGCCELYVVVLSGKYKFFQNPKTVWHGWSLETPPSGDIYSIQVIHIAFYLHWTYATIFLDRWKKESVVLVFHHIFTLILMSLAKAANCHNIAVLTLLLHDMCDIIFDFTMLCSFFKTQGRKVKQWMNIMTYVGLICNLAVWFACRLYWYPLKVVYFAAANPKRFEIPCCFLMNLLLWIQVILNYYWFSWLLRILHYSLRNKFGDPREYVITAKSSEESDTDKKRNSDILKKKY